MKYKIAFIDDEPKHLRTYKRRANDHFDIVDIELVEELTLLINSIIDNKLNAVVVDFNLTAADVRYTGADIVDALSIRLPDLPVFMLTAFEDNAEINVYDVNKIYVKEDYFSNSDRLNKRIKLQINHYLNNIKIKQDRISFLLSKLKEKKLSIQEEEELLELDDYIESSFMGVSTVPKDLKRISNSELLNKLVNNADCILKEIKK